MITRRLLRIKALLILYANFCREGESIEKSGKELLFSLQKSYDLYHYLMLIVLEIAIFVDKKIKNSKKRNIADEKDIQSKQKFVNNRLISRISKIDELRHYLKSNILSYSREPELIKSLFKDIESSKKYKEYTTSGEDSYREDRDFLISVYTHEILGNEQLEQVLEEHNIYWNDDLDIIINMIVKTLQPIPEDISQKPKIMPKFKDKEDEEFGLNLLTKTILTHEKNMKMIRRFSKNWDVERIAVIDTLVLSLAITELTQFPTIPVKVTFNEYIEIAKQYSTTKSSVFINGVLDKVLKSLKKQKKIHKEGKGLIDSGRNST
jgi:transcription antitermination protein NusB